MSVRIVAVVAGLSLVAAAVACSSMDDSLGGGGVGADGGSSGNDASSPNPAFDGGPNAIASTGLVIVHAAAFPAFRICFSNFPDRLPFPDRSVMPQSNVVGVEVGSVVRLDPLTSAPGEVYVIDESQVKATAGSPDDKPCGSLICDAGSGCLRENRDWTRAGTITSSVGESNVQVLAITGCGNIFFLQDVGATSAQCGSDWDSIAGNLKYRLFPLQATMRDPNAPSLPVQLVQMSQLVEAQREAGALEVSYGGLDGGSAPLSYPVAQDPPLFQPGAQVDLPLTPNDDAIFASQGFRIALRGGDGGAEAGASFLVDTTLAEVQALSAPRAVPGDYYHAASSYALLLLGDPANPPVFSDGGTNAGYDPRHGVHLLAIPVAAPDADAGTEAGVIVKDGG